MSTAGVAVALSFAPVAQLQAITPSEANACLRAWKHRMGPIERRPEYGLWCHALLHEGRAVAVTTTSTLIRDHVGGGLEHLTRDDTIELSRLCAAQPGLCRAMLRLWRELLLPSMPGATAISYQDAVMHRGDVYRFDGWARSPRKSRSGTDQRSGATGRAKWIWVWPPHAATPAVTRGAA